MNKTIWLLMALSMVSFANSSGAAQVSAPTASSDVAGPHDGRIEVALAIQTTCQTAGAFQVIINPDGSWQTSPDSAFDGTFSDLGFNNRDRDMQAFKSALATLLPEIASDVAELPENPDMPVEQVADYVRLSLLTVGVTH